MTLTPRLDAARRTLARQRWRGEILDMALTWHNGWNGQEVPLEKASVLLPINVIADAIEQACFDYANTMCGGALPWDADVPEPGIEYAVVYNRDDLTNRLNAAVLTALSDGTLAGTGYDSRAPVDTPRHRVPADRWRGLSVDFRRSFAAGDGFSLSQIQVDGSGAPVRRPGRPNAKCVSVALFTIRRSNGIPLSSQKAEAAAITEIWPSDGPAIPKVSTVSEHISVSWHAAKAADDKR